MTYYAHTAEDSAGHHLPEDSGRWQPLASHLRNVARLARHFAAPLGLGDEAELAGLLRGVDRFGVDFKPDYSEPTIL